MVTNDARNLLMRCTKNAHVPHAHTVVDGGDAITLVDDEDTAAIAMCSGANDNSNDNDMSGGVDERTNNTSRNRAAIERAERANKKREMSDASYYCTSAMMDLGCVEGSAPPLLVHSMRSQTCDLMVHLLSNAASPSVAFTRMPRVLVKISGCDVEDEDDDEDDEVGGGEDPDTLGPIIIGYVS